MPRTWPEESLVEFSSRVPEADYQKFVGNLPMHGATSWFIRNALIAFNEECDRNPSIIDNVREAITEMLKSA